MLKNLFALSFMGVLCLVTAQDKLKISAAEQLVTGRKEVAIESTDDPQVFRVEGSSSLYSRDSIAIDLAKTYRLSGEFRNATPDKAPRVSFGVNCLDARKRTISGGSVGALPGTESELAADFNGGDTVLKVKDASEWKKGRIVVFKVDASGKLSDLPNSNTEYLAVKEITANADNQYDVTMSAPLKKSYPAGTSVRQHESDQWFHLVTLNAPLNQEWQKFEFTFKGESALGSEAGKWRKDSKFAGIAAYANTWRVKDAAIEFKNLLLEETEP